MLSVPTLRTMRLCAEWGTRFVGGGLLSIPWSQNRDLGHLAKFAEGLRDSAIDSQSLPAAFPPSIFV